MSGFIKFLESRADTDTRMRATLRRSLSFTPGAFVPAYPYVEPFLNEGDQSWRRKAHYLVAGLWASHWREGSDRHTVSIGKACAAHQASSGSTSTERRFVSLLDADADQLPNRLRQLVALLKDQPLDFERLLVDLLYWNDEEKGKQLALAKDFYRAIDTETQDEPADKEEVVS